VEGTGRQGHRHPRRRTSSAEERSALELAPQTSGRRKNAFKYSVSGSPASAGWSAAELPVRPERGALSLLALGQPGRVEDDGVEPLTVAVQCMEHVEGVGLLDLDVASAVAPSVLSKSLRGPGVLLHRHHRGAPRGEGQGKAPVVAEGIERPPPAELTGPEVVLRLVEEAAGLHVSEEIGVKDVLPLSPVHLRRGRAEEDSRLPRELLEVPTGAIVPGHDLHR